MTPHIAATLTAAGIYSFRAVCRSADESHIRARTVQAVTRDEFVPECLRLGAGAQGQYEIGQSRNAPPNPPAKPKRPTHLAGLVTVLVVGKAGPAISLARDLLAVVLLLVGLPLGGVGWLVGLGLLWSSATWNRPDKLLGTLLIPGGLPFAVILALFGVPALFGFSDDLNALQRTVVVLLQVVVLAAPLYTAVHLSRRLIKARRLS